MQADHGLRTRPGRGAVDGDELFENLVGLSLQDLPGLISETVEVKFRLRRFGALVGHVDERSHSSLAHLGESIERRHLFGEDAVRAQGAIKQKASPTIREAVVEDAGQSLEQIRISRNQARSQRESMRRYLQTR